MSTQHSVVVALDGSEPAFEALDEARDLARAMGRDLSALYVFPHQSGVSATPAGLDERTSREHLQTMAHSESKEIFDAAEKRIGSSFARRHVLTGDPAEEIIAFLADNPGTHLVMGRRGLGKIRAMLLGSVSAKVAAQSRGLVTVV